LEDTHVSFRSFCVALYCASICRGNSVGRQYGTPEEAKAMLQRAVAAVKEDKGKALDMFNKGEGGFKDRDLYVFCANASDGILTAHPNLKGEDLQDIKGKKGFPLGQEIMRTAEPLRVDRRLFRLSHAAMAGSFSMA
jgi:hypothetical protein